MGKDIRVCQSLPHFFAFFRSRQTSRVVRMNLANLPGGEEEEVEDEAEVL